MNHDYKERKLFNYNVLVDLFLLANWGLVQYVISV